MTALENQVRRLVHHAADALPDDAALADRIAARTVAVPIPHAGRSAARRVAVPVLASVAAVVVVVLLVSALVGGAHHESSPVAPVSSSSVPSPGPTSPSASPTVSTATSEGVRLDDAVFPVPAGWTATRETFHPSALPGVDVWCVKTPNSRPVSDASSCALIVERVDGATANTEVLEPDVSVPEFGIPCHYGTTTVTDNADKSFGGRPADFRRYRLDCLQGKTSFPVAPLEYVVATDPGFIVYSFNPDTALVAMITRLAARATLPAQDAPVRLTDFGLVRSATTHRDGSWTIELDRAIPNTFSLINNNPATYRYDIPKSAWHGFEHSHGPPIGWTVRITSNGHVVTHASDVESAAYMPKCLTAQQAYDLATGTTGPATFIDSSHGYDCLDGWAYVNMHNGVHGNHSTRALQYVDGAWQIGNRLIGCGYQNVPPAMPDRVAEWGCGN